MGRAADGVLFASLGDYGVAYDLRTETLHRMSSTAVTALSMCDGRTPRQHILDVWSSESGLVSSDLAPLLEDLLSQFTDLGLFEDADLSAPPSVRGGSDRPTVPGEVVGPCHYVLDHTIRFRSRDPELLQRIDDYLGTAMAIGASGPESGGLHDARSLVFDVNWLADGDTELVMDSVETHDHVDTLLRRLVTNMTDYAADAHGCLTLHAGAVRSPEGVIVALPGQSGSGKSTLTAALIASGWDYLSDESVGIGADLMAFGYPKRLILHPESREILNLGQTPDRHVSPTSIRSNITRLGGPVGPVDYVIYPTLTHGAQCTSARLDLQTHFDHLLANTLNLAITRQVGFETLCGLAENSTAYELTFSDPFEAVDLISQLAVVPSCWPDPLGTATQRIDPWLDGGPADAGS